jgi:hypothetical protein
VRAGDAASVWTQGSFQYWWPPWSYLRGTRKASHRGKVLRRVGSKNQNPKFLEVFLFFSFL